MDIFYDENKENPHSNVMVLHFAFLVFADYVIELCSRPTIFNVQQQCKHNVTL